MRTIGPVLLVLFVVGSMFAETPYFPVRKNRADPGVSEFEAAWYGKALHRMNEPRLPESAKDPATVVYRFTVLPTWGNPIAVRAQEVGGNFTLFARRLDGFGGYDPGKLVEKKDVKLTEAESKQLASLITRLQFFDMAPNDDVQGDDGDEWILEGVSEGRYHVVQRWCASKYDPKKRGLEPFLALCEFLISKSALSARPENKGNELLPTK